MKKIVIRAVGKLPEAWQREGVKMYLERLTPFTTVEIVELPEGHKGSARPNIEKTKEIEGAALLKGIAEDTCVIALDEHGKIFGSETFAGKLSEWGEGGRAMIFVIGGSWGLSEDVRRRAHATLALGQMTLPHGLARLVLLEQLYRAFMIQNGREYHK